MNCSWEVGFSQDPPAEQPKRLQAKKEQSPKVRKNLGEAVEASAEGVKVKNVKFVIAKLRSVVHARHEVLEKIFE